MLIRMWEKEKSYSLLVSVQADGVSVEISVGVLQKAINEIIIKPYSIPWHICKGLCTHCQDTFSVTFFAALFITVRK